MPSSVASNSAVSSSSAAAMLLTTPRASSLPRIVRAGTPTASEKVRTVHGRLTTTLPLRGAAVLAPVRRMWVRRTVDGPLAAVAGLSSSSPPTRRLAVAARFRFNCRCSRPPIVLTPAPSPSSTAAGGRAAGTARRGRSLPPDRSGGGAGGTWASPLRGGPRLAARSSRLFRSSCFRICSERGFVPALLARIASRGSLMSGFCGAGSLAFGLGVAGAAGMGARCIASPGFSTGL